MQSKTSCFKTLFGRVLSRYWPLWLTFAGMLVMMAPVSVSSQLRMLDVPQIAMQPHIASETYQLLSWAPLIAMASGLAAAIACFDHLFSAKLTGLVASLPVKREKTFAAHFFAGATMLVSAILLAAIILLGVQSAHGGADFKSAATWFGVFSLETLTFYAIAVFCCMLTGHVLVSIPLYLLVNFAGGMLYLLLMGLYNTFCFGVEGGFNGGAWLNSLSPCVRLLGSGLFQYRVGNDYGSTVTGFAGWGWVLGYFAVGVVLSVAALMLYRNRRMECAQDTVAFPILKPILKYIVTFYAAMGVPFAIQLFYGESNFAAHIALTVVGAVLGYFISEMIIHKSLRVFHLKGWLGAAAAALACILLVCAFQFDWFGYAKFIPAASDIEQVELSAGGETFYLKSEDGIDAVREIHQAVLDAHYRGEAGAYAPRGNYFYLNLNYQLKNGRMVFRNYWMPYSKDDDSLAGQIERALNDGPIFSGWEELNPPIAVSEKTIQDAWIYAYTTEGEELELPLTKAEMLDLYENGIRPDCIEGNYGPITLYPDQSFYEEQYHLTIDLELFEEDAQLGRDGYYISFTPSIRTEHTNAWLQAHDVPLVQDQEVTGPLG